ncbi:MAG: N-6 DNA methylase [Vampirovibrio sp.]|nr:N-6 DNA methylase [Vampirovibrio sp.]
MIIKQNERSWAIDVISEINAYSKGRSKSIVRAGGESSLGGGRTTLFPDVILFGDSYQNLIYQGWELKFPDTSLDNVDFIENAKAKAIRMGTKSFLLWNVDQARLYKIDAKNQLECLKTYETIGVLNRNEVQFSKHKWLPLLHEILDDLNDLFYFGSLKSSSVQELFDDQLVSTIIDMFSGQVADAIQMNSQKDAVLRANIGQWWKESKVEYFSDKIKDLDYNILAKTTLINWSNRILFAHYLKQFRDEARVIEQIKCGSNIEEAIIVFEKLTSLCDFFHVFEPAFLDAFIGEVAWDGICQLNEFLSTLELQSIPHEIFKNVLESSIQISNRKMVGQYPTPNKLAELLVALTLDNLEGTVLDPCCGTGTIPKAVYQYKKGNSSLSPQDCLKTVWASDKFQLPLQLSTLSLAFPEVMGEVVQVFCKDVFTLEYRESLTFTDPNSGERIRRELPLFDCIVSNLPFVRFEDAGAVNPNLPVAKDLGLDGKSDLWAYVLHKIYDLVKEGGKVGLIVSNSWLGTNWREKLLKSLRGKFEILTVVISAKGKWFKNADVVTSLIVLSKNSDSSSLGDVLFVKTHKCLDDWIEADIQNIFNSSILRQEVHNSTFSSFLHTKQQIAQHSQCFSSWMPFFTNISWFHLLKTKLVKASTVFDIARGERRGWDKLFYPSNNHTIESEYLRPVLKNMSTVKAYFAQPDSQAFCCSDDMEFLESMNKQGAFAWVKQFESQCNEKGKSLPEVLTRANSFWYEMRTEAQADIVMGMNPEDRLFAAKMQQRGFVNQRLIRFTSKQSNLDIDLAHALLNSVLGIFFIEANGFGRGLGVLDLSAERMKTSLLMWDINQLSEDTKKSLKRSWLTVCNRDVLPLEQEIQEVNRVAFDQLVFDSFGVSHLYPTVKNTLLDLYHIRKSTLADTPMKNETETDCLPT